MQLRTTSSEYAVLQAIAAVSLAMRMRVIPKRIQQTQAIETPTMLQRAWEVDSRSMSHDGLETRLMCRFDN